MIYNRKFSPQKRSYQTCGFYALGTYSTFETYSADQEYFEQNALHRYALAFEDHSGVTKQAACCRLRSGTRKKPQKEPTHQKQSLKTKSQSETKPTDFWFIPTAVAQVFFLPKDFIGRLEVLKAKEKHSVRASLGWVEVGTSWGVESVFLMVLIG